MKECSVKMETSVSEIQIETKAEKRPGAASPQKERQEKKTATLCFKRRKKANKTKAKAGTKSAEETKKHAPEAGGSGQRQAAGAWASIKRLVTHRKRSESAKKQKPSETDVQPEDGALPKKKAKSRLKIPCIRFSGGAKKSRHSKLTEDSGYVRVQGEADNSEIKAQTQPDDQGMQARSTQDLQEGVMVRDGKEIQESHVSNSVTAGENVIAVELAIVENESSALQMGIPGLEKETKGITEKQSAQAQQASRLESSAAGSPRPVTSAAPPSPAATHQRSLEEPSDGIRESAPSEKDGDRRRKIAAEEKKSGETALGQAEEAAVGQADRSALSHAETAAGHAEEATVIQTEGQAKEGKLSQAEEATVAQAKETVLSQAKEGKLSQAEESAVSQAEEAMVVQAKKATVGQAEEATVGHTEKATVDQAEEPTVGQAEEPTVGQAEEPTVDQAEEPTVGQAEEPTVGQAVEPIVGHAEEATVDRAEGTVLSHEPDLKENGIDTEKPRSEESKRMEPIAIIITDTEISEFDVKKSKNVPKQFLISMENEQEGVFANDSDFEGRTSEQYETLLIETASSLVKNAIELSVEQLVNEMVSEVIK